MAANWKLNAFLGLTAFLLTYLFSYTNNMWQTSLFRAGIGFLVFFVLGYVVRLVLNKVKIKNTSSSIHEHHSVEGSYVEMEASRHEGNEWEESFQQIPLNGLHKGENT
jgi:hypothetical protein